MPSAHAKLSPSASERWLSCPASIRLGAALPPGHDDESVYAREGTIAHALGELEAGLEFGLISKAKYDTGLWAWRKEFDKQEYHESTLAEMQGHIRDYVDFIKMRLAAYPHAQIMLEQRMDCGIPACWGTSDVVIVSPTHIEIIDLKYGMGIKVEAEGNTQLRIYCLGAYDKFGTVLGDTEHAIMTVFQPRIYHYDSDEVPLADLLKWREEYVIPRAELALSMDKDAPFGPSEKACKFCPVAGSCVARAEAAIEADFGDPFDDTVLATIDQPLTPAIVATGELMTPEQVGAVLPKLDFIRNWCDAVENYALDLAYSQGVKVPGYKVVRSGGRRSIPNHKAAIDALMAAAADPENKLDFDIDAISVAPPVERKIKGLGDLERVVGKKRLPVLLGDLLKPGTGKESLVPESDKREEITPTTEAQKDFDDLPELDS